MIDCKNYHPIIKLNKCKFDERYLQKKLFTFILPSCWLFNCVVTCGQRQCPVTTEVISRMEDSRQLRRQRRGAVRLEIEAWGRHIKGGNLFHLRIRLYWPGLDTAHCQGLISGAGTRAAVQSAFNKRRSVAAFLAYLVFYLRFLLFRQGWECVHLHRIRVWNSSLDL